jgi:hypothetical protein
MAFFKSLNGGILAPPLFISGVRNFVVFYFTSTLQLMKLQNPSLFTGAEFLFMVIGRLFISCHKWET